MCASCRRFGESIVDILMRHQRARADGLTAREIAHLAGAPVPAIRTRLAAALTAGTVRQLAQRRDRQTLYRAT